MPQTWKDRIAKAKKRGRFLFQDVEDSKSYQTCALGEAAKEIGVGPYTLEDKFWPGIIIGVGEKNLPMEFWRALERDDFDRAEELRQEIRDTVGAKP